jgi:purine-binding chemotaxis protein CheW
MATSVNKENEKFNSYLTFRLGEETFAANVSKVLNILEMVKVTKVPKSPRFMKGVINLRGDVLPLIDTRTKFDMEETPITNNTCILVLDIERKGKKLHVGALVDAVLEVLEFEDRDILPPPSYGSKYKSEFITGMVNKEDHFIMILDMDLIFTTDEIIELMEKTDVQTNSEPVIEK